MLRLRLRLAGRVSAGSEQGVEPGVDRTAKAASGFELDPSVVDPTEVVQADRVAVTD